MASNTQYHLRDSQRILYILRIAQILLALVYLTLLCYSGVNRGWWLNLSQPLALGVTAAILTLPIAAPILFAYNSANAAADRRTFVLHYARVIAEWLLIALWAASFITMLLPKGKNFQVLFQQPPYAEWDVAVALAGFETIAFVYTMVLVLQEKYIGNPNPRQATYPMGVRRRRGHSRPRSNAV